MPATKAKSARPPEGWRDRELLTITEAAAVLRVSPGAAYKMASEGTLPGARKFGAKAVRVQTAALIRWIEGEGQ